MTCAPPPIIGWDSEGPIYAEPSWLGQLQYNLRTHKSIKRDNPMRNLPFLDKSEHQQRVEAFMLRMKSISQDVPLEPTIPSDDILVLRAKLIFEEAMETIEGLGVTIQLKEFTTEPYTLASHPAALHDPAIARPTLTPDTVYEFFRDARKTPDLVEIVDGCCDLKVVTTGTLSACGVPDLIPQRIVDDNNLQKFAPGHSFREDGKLIKPPNHRPCTESLRYVLAKMISGIDCDTKRERLGLSDQPYARTIRRAENGSRGQQQDSNIAAEDQRARSFDMD
jgi:hypothetical protein